MDDDSVLVPPEVEDGLDTLREAGTLHVGERDRAIEDASDRGLDATVSWLEQVDEVVYERAADGRFVADDEA